MGKRLRSLNRATRWLQLLSAVALVVAGYMVGLETTQTVRAASCNPFSFSPQFRYSTVSSSLAAYGIDGYIAYSNGALTDPACDHLNYDLTLFNQDATPPGWVQAGVAVGLFNTVYTTWRSYAEQTDCYYEFFHTTNSPPGNQAYYIQYTGDPPYICPYGGGRYVYPVAVRNGSVYSPPVFYTVLYASNGHWSAQYEAFTRHYGTPLWESSGTAYWGLPYTDLGYGMHWYNQPTGQWNTWTSAPGCNAYTSDAIYTGAVDRVCSAFEGYKR